MLATDSLCCLPTYLPTYLVYDVEVREMLHIFRKICQETEAAGNNAVRMENKMSKAMFKHWVHRNGWPSVMDPLVHRLFSILSTSGAPLSFADYVEFLALLTKAEPECRFGCTLKGGDLSADTSTSDDLGTYSFDSGVSSIGRQQRWSGELFRCFHVD